MIGGGREERVAVSEQLALHEVHVEVAVVVVVEESRARSRHLRLVELAGHAVEVDEVEPGLGGPIDEPLPVGAAGATASAPGAGAGALSAPQAATQTARSR